MDNVGGIWGMAQSTNNPALITACLPLLCTDIPMLVRMKPNINQLKEAFQLPSIKAIGGEGQLRLVAKWMDVEQISGVQNDPVEQLDNLLPLVDFSSMTDATLLDFMGENYAMVASPQCR